MNKLEFNSEKHEYTLDGVIIPSYSRIVKDLGIAADYSGVRQSVLEYKADIGKAVHTAILWDSTNELDVNTLDTKEVLPRFKSWLMFKELYQPKILTQYCEVPICSVKWRYGVTPDILAEVQGVLTIIELKTVVQMSISTALQTEAQKIAVEETYKLKIKQRWGLQLIPDAMPKLEVYAATNDSIVWLSAVNLWQYKERNNLWKR